MNNITEQAKWAPLEGGFLFIYLLMYHVFTYLKYWLFHSTFYQCIQIIAIN